MDLHNELIKRHLIDFDTDPLVGGSDVELNELLAMMLEDDTLSDSTKTEIADLLFRLNCNSR
ncbi:hypothetical protein HR060_06140 [Catenovulum sp. SM1970]|uniref:hypothetical protein n=1 Tax=Marinifaba aquimaris TaxID=2741323 RepID=UPI001574DDAB|nr:hypothetical protein [Marinifaba aquimaris]NTS76445.1 hypothetical protein [Marinifaba aquimaris]